MRKIVIIKVWLSMKYNQGLRSVSSVILHLTLAWLDDSFVRSFGRLVAFDETLAVDRMIYVHSITLKRIIREMGHYSYLSK